MNNEQFNKVLNRRIRLIRSSLIKKAEEYSTDSDRMRTFNRAGVIQEITPEKALLGMWSKQLVSILDLIESFDSSSLPSPELIDEKIGDSINYLILLEAMMKEDIK